MKSYYDKKPTTVCTMKLSEYIISIKRLFSDFSIRYSKEDDINFRKLYPNLNSMERYKRKRILDRLDRV